MVNNIYNLFLQNGRIRFFEQGIERQVSADSKKIKKNQHHHHISVLGSGIFVGYLCHNCKGDQIQASLDVLD